MTEDLSAQQRYGWVILVPRTPPPLIYPFGQNGIRFFNEVDPPRVVDPSNNRLDSGYWLIGQRAPPLLLHNRSAKLGGLICHIRQKNSKFFVAGCLRLFPCSNHSENLINRKISIFWFETISKFIFQLQEKIFSKGLAKMYPQI